MANVPDAQGLLVDSATGALLTVDVAAAVAPFGYANGFRVDANSALITLATPATSDIQGGFRREVGANANYWALVTVPFASAVGPTGTFDGFLRDANYSLVTVTNALAAAPTSPFDGFVRDANYALVIQ